MVTVITLKIRNFLLIGLCLFSLSVAAEDRSVLILELYDQVDQLRNELQLLRDENERLRHQFEKFADEYRPLSEESDTDAAEQDMETPVHSDKVATPSTEAVSPPETEVEMPKFPVKPAVQESSKPSPSTKVKSSAFDAIVVPATASEDEKKAYAKVVAYLDQDKFEQLQIALVDFLDQHGDGAYAVEANYLLGEIRYEKQLYEQAMENFSQIVEWFPDSEKVDAARLKMAYIYYAWEDKSAARDLLETLLDSDHEQINHLARKRLDRMDRE